MNSGADFPGHTNDGSAAEHLGTPETCGLCGRPISDDGEAYIILGNVDICGDCKFLLLEDVGNEGHDSRWRRPIQRRRLTRGGSELTEDRLIQQFSQMINLVRHVHHEPEDLHEARTTPSGSRRWRRIVSDTESDGFNSDLFYGESESNISFGAYRGSYGDGGSISFSADGVDSDASVDDHSLLYRDLFLRSVVRSDSDSDSDIDPMGAGAVEWNSDDREVNDHEWEEVDAEDNAVGSPESGAHYISNERVDLSIRRTTDYREFEDISDGAYHGNSGDYLDAQGFEEFLEHLAETDSSRRGAPPASSSFVNCLPVVFISEEHQKPDDLACAVCKDLMPIGTEAKQLPCLHLYHPSCILPWLSARNSCPLCRYELPTDDIDYEQRKFNARNYSRMVITEIRQHGSGDDSSSNASYSDASEMNEVQELIPEGAIPTNGGRGRWVFLAAAPVVGLMGAVLMLWLGNSLTRTRLQAGPHNGQRAPRVGSFGSVVHNQRVRRRWWWF